MANKRHGDVFFCTKKICNGDLVAEVKSLPGLDTARRLSGEYVLFKIAVLL